MSLIKSLAPIAVFIGIGAVLFLTAGGHLYSPDEEVMFRTTEAIVQHGTLAIEPMAMGFGTKSGRDGQQFGQYGIGNSLAAIPLYLTGTVVNSDAMLPGDTIREILDTGSLENAQRYSYPSAIDYARRFAVAHTNIFVTLLQVIVIYAFAMALTGNRPGAIMVCLMYALGSQAWPHSKTFFSEPLATLCLTAGALFLWRGLERGTVWRLFIGGLCLGFAVLTRLDSVVAFPGLIVMFYIALLRPRSSGDVDEEEEEEEEEGEDDEDEDEDIEEEIPIGRLSPIAAHIAVAIPLILTLLIILGLNWWKFGSPTSTGYEDQPEGLEFSAHLSESIPGFLWSPGRSLFLHSPPVLLGVLGFWVLIRRRPALGLGVLIAFAATLIFHAKWQNWSGGWDWGPRHIFSLIAWSMIPMAALLHRGARAFVRISCIMLLFIGIAVQLIAISENPLEFYHQYHFKFMAGNMPAGDYYEIARSEGVRPPTLDDSVWVAQWSAWNGYGRLWDRGVHDLFWLRWWQWLHADEANGDSG